MNCVLTVNPYISPCLGSAESARAPDLVGDEREEAGHRGPDHGVLVVEEVPGEEGQGADRGDVVHHPVQGVVTVLPTQAAT